MILASAMKTISLTQLVSSCMDANRQGCEIIKSFHEAHQTAIIDGSRLKVGGDAKSVVTQADVDAQAIILKGLRDTWGNDLLIIGEEDETEVNPPSNKVDDSSSTIECCLRKDILFHHDEVQTVIPQDCDEEIPIEELAIFVDPLDGTREFVEGRLQNVACLIGIVRNNRPIAGVIGLPFPSGNPSSDPIIHYAVADQIGIAGAWPKIESNLEPESDTGMDKDAAGVTILTGDSDNPVLKNATFCANSIAKNANHLIIGGTAAKLRFVAASPTPTIAILHFETELWDTAAAEALLNCKGGKITDLFGSPLVHSPNRKFGNIFGVVASSGSDEARTIHNELCRRMRADTESVNIIFQKWMGEMTTPDVPQAIDLARDLDGIPYNLPDLQKLLKNKNPNGSKLVGYSVPEADAWRGLMSNGVRFQLHWEDGNTLSTSDMFYKRIVMADLTHARDKLKTAPHKLIRDVRSYSVETSFLTSEACRCLVNDTGIRINKVLGSDLRPVEGLDPKELLESRFSIFLQYFQKSDGWEQRWLLDKEETKAALGDLAKMHAYFWQGSQFWDKDGCKVGKELESIVWENGGYMQPKLQGIEQLTKVRSGWEARYPTFEVDLQKISELEGADIQSLGQRLEDVAPIVGRKAHPFSESGTENSEFSKYRTLIHGDPKHANFFFRQKQDSKTDEREIEVGVIDFQWSGFGLAATDVAHHITSAVSSSAVSLDGKEEAELLDHYYSCLSKALVKFGVGKNEKEIEESIFPREILQKQYETAFLDVCRIVFAYAWRRWKAEPEPTQESFNRNAYNKSLESVLWLTTRCHVLLEKYEKD